MSENPSQPAASAPQDQPGGFAPDGGEDEISLLDLLLVVAENARLLIFGPLLAGLAALGIAFIIPPTFTATTRILPPQQQQGAADMANAYVQELHKLTGSLAITEAQQRRVFFEKRLQQAQENLKKAELALGRTGAGESLIRSAPQAMVEGIARLKAQVTTREFGVRVNHRVAADSDVRSFAWSVTRSDSNSPSGLVYSRPRVLI